MSEMLNVAKYSSEILNSQKLISNDQKKFLPDCVRFALAKYQEENVRIEIRTLVLKVHSGVCWKQVTLPS